MQAKELSALWVEFPALASVDLKRLKKKLVTQLATHPPYCSQRNFGASALDWCYSAVGRYDMYLHGGQKLWDYAAGALIFLESGGHACCIETDDFAQGDICGFFFFLREGKNFLKKVRVVWGGAGK